MREIVRSENSFGHQQFAGIEWNAENIFNYDILLIENSNNITPQAFNENIEFFYKKWLVGTEVEFTIPTKLLNWNVQENLVPTILGIAEKNEYLARKAQKIIQQNFSDKQTVIFNTEIDTLINNLDAATSPDEQNKIIEEAKKVEEHLRHSVSSTKNISLEKKWVEDGVFNESYLQLKPKLNQIFDKLKQIIANSFHQNYITISPKVEAAYVQSKLDENYNDTRKNLIELQREVVAIRLERWQKNELMDRLRAAFDHINVRQDEWRIKEDTKRLEHSEALQKEYDVIIPQAVNSSFSEGFGLLKNLQELTNKSSLPREKRDTFYKALDEAFTTLKQKADAENDANKDIATKQIEVAILDSKNVDLFKDARAILIAAQNELKEIRLSKKHKDELFGKLREAFDALNAEQDAFYAEQRKENKNQLEDVLINLKRVLARKKEGIETLYQAKANAESRTMVIKVDKNSDGSILNQFNQRITEITTKVTEAEKEITQLENKIQKIENELMEEKNAEKN
jgi:hypothetical protein